jgi:LCP family protein required for cell wall assembly
MRRRGRLAVGLISLAALSLAGASYLVPDLRQQAVMVASLAAVARNDVDSTDLDSRAPRGPMVYLVVGTDQRHVPIGARRDIRSERADAIMLWAIRDDSTLVLSVPRDLRTHVPGHGDGKVGGTLEYGPATLVAAIRSLTRAPVHHYVELEFSAFSEAVDRVGGLRVDLARPARDDGSALRLPRGPQTLSGTEALAFVRSRQHEELVDDRWVRDPSGDLGRIARQHDLLSSVVDAVRRCGGLDCARLLADLGGAVSVDRAFTADDLRVVGAALSRKENQISTATLPTVPARPPDDSLSPFPPAHPGSVGYRLLDFAAARPLLEQLLPTGV